jgi:hypothetical protein
MPLGASGQCLLGLYMLLLGPVHGPVTNIFERKDAMQNKDQNKGSCSSGDMQKSSGSCSSGDMKKSSGSCGTEAKKTEQMGSCGSSAGKGKSGSCS